QPGSFLVLATLGIYAASYFSSSRKSWKETIRRVAVFPPVWASALAVALRPIVFASSVETLLDLGMKTLIPLALISVGAQLEFRKNLFSRELSPLAIGLGYKLILAPLLIALLFAGTLGQTGQPIRITILEA